MTNMQIGLQLTVIGMSLVFFVLLLLMYTMKLMSAIILNAAPTQSLESVPVTENSSDNDQALAAVMAIAVNRTTEFEGKPIEIKLSQTNQKN
jgi:sodium pump decarboxylase gamma subunit